MSAFDNDNKDKAPEDKNYLEELVGEGKKFRDAESLAKGKFESDQHISNLERQLSELREDLEKDDKVDKLLELVRSQIKDQDPPAKSPNGGTGNEHGDGKSPSDTSSDLTEEQLKSLIESHLSEHETTNQRKKNLEEVDKALDEHFGERAGTHLQAKATELNLSLKEMEEMAARNPRAFFQLIGLNTKGKPTPSMMMGGGRSDEVGAGPKDGRRDFAFYQKMRRENKKLYYTPTMQHQMFLDSKELGPSFYET
jgi:hypothetical protein